MDIETLHAVVEAERYLLLGTVGVMLGLMDDEPAWFRAVIMLWSAMYLIRGIWMHIEMGL